MERVLAHARVEVIAGLLQASGLPEDQATEVGWSCVVDYPLVRRRGVTVLAHDLVSRGLAAVHADEAAATLLALELADAGLPLVHILSDLNRRGLSGTVALGVAYEGIRLHRSLGQPEPVEEPAPDPLAMRLWVLLALALSTSAVLALV